MFRDSGNLPIRPQPEPGNTVIHVHRNTSHKFPTNGTRYTPSPVCTYTISAFSFFPSSLYCDLLPHSLNFPSHLHLTLSTQLFNIYLTYFHLFLFLYHFTHLPSPQDVPGMSIYPISTPFYPNSYLVVNCPVILRSYGDEIDLTR
jgi:hypothetical protein